MLGVPNLRNIVTGDIAIDLGVYGVPETFILDADGFIRYRHVGIITNEIWNSQLKPIVEQLQVGA